MNLYEIPSEMESCIDFETGEIDTAKLDSLKELFADKTENLIKWIKSLKSEAEAIKAEIKALTERKQAKENKAENLSNYLSSIMTANNIPKFDYPSGVAKFGKSTAVEVDAEFVKWAQENAEQFLKFKDPEPDKTAIKEALKLGKVVEHAQIVERQNLQIK